MDYRVALEEILTKCGTINSDESIYIWGAGNTTDLNYDIIEKEGLIPCAFIDNNKTGFFHGIKIIKASEIDTKTAKLILVSSAVPKRNREIMEQIKSQIDDIKTFSIDEIIFGRHKEELLRTFDLLSSEESKQTYYEIIKARINGTNLGNVIITDDQYFHYAPFKTRNRDEVYVDCGAFVGDTVEQYLFRRSGTFRKIIAIEPDIRNVKLLKNRVKRLRKEWCTEGSSIDIVYGAIGSYDGELYINDSIESISTKVNRSNHGKKIDVYTIDALTKDTGVGYIKADIEGYEMDMLQGAKDSIVKYKPMMSICVYHKTTDLFTIPLYLNELNPDYKFEIAHHYYDYNETVLYAFMD